jgi:prolyl oligopeptidase
MRQKRANVYADFIAASEYLVREQWTDPSHLVIWGASSGGLLVSVAMTERPDLYAGVVAEVPLTDMIRYRIGGNGPLWVDEYGSPDNAEEFATLRRFSPYHNVRPGVSYPWLLVMGSENDDRMNPMHGRKFVAALKAADPTGLFLLRTEGRAAHFGPSTETARVRSRADMLAFALAAIDAHSRH